MRVFVDVGAYYGEAVSIALDPDWGFDKIYAIEPADICHPLLRQYRDRRVSIEPVALGKRSGTAVLFGAGLLGASIFEIETPEVRAWKAFKAVNPSRARQRLVPLTHLCRQ